MGAKTSSLMAYINDFNDRGDYEGIIKFIEALTPEEQTSDMVSQLARAYNNLAQAGETQPLEKALQLLDSIEPEVCKILCLSGPGRGREKSLPLVL